MGNAYKVSVAIPFLSPLLDSAHVSFTFEDITAGGGTSGSLSGLATAVIAFFNSQGSQTKSMAGYMPTCIDRTANSCLVSIQNITGHLDGTAAGSPISLTNFSLGAPGTLPVSLPEGVSLALSWRAAYGTDVEYGPVTDIPTPKHIVDKYGADPTHKGRTRPRARDRNRTYLGPLGVSTIGNEATTNRCQFTTSFVGDALKALQTLSLVNVSGEPNFALRTWSRRNASLKLATTLYADDRPDYQQRRTDPSNLRQALASLAV
jgi:hypothetical protein